MADSKRRLISPVLWLFIGTMILANIAGQMDVPLRPLYVQQLGASVSQVGLFFTLGAIAPLILQIYGGWLSDSIGRLQAIAIGSLGGVLGYVVYIVAPSWQWLLLASVFSAAAFAFVGPSFQAFIAEQSTEENRGRVYGLMQTMFMVVGVIGPPVGGFIAQDLSFKTMFMVAGALYAIAALIRILMARSAGEAQKEKGETKERPTFANLKSSLTAMAGLLVSGGIITWIFISDGIRDITGSYISQLTPLYLENLMDLTLTQIGFLNSIFSIAVMALSGFGGWLSDKTGERVGIVGGFIVMIIGNLIFFVSHLFWHFAIAWAIFGAGRALINPAYNSLISKAVPNELRGTAFGLFATSIGIISLPSPWIGAQLWEAFTPLTPFYVNTVALLLPLPIMWIKFKLPRSEPEPQPATAEG